MVGEELFSGGYNGQKLREFVLERFKTGFIFVIRVRLDDSMIRSVGRKGVPF